MRTKQFITQLDQDRLVSAIAAAEKTTSGEIRVFVARRKTDDPVRSAQREFHRMGMDRTQLRNGVLLYVAPESQGFAIIGDEAIHQKCGQNFWGEVAEAMRSKFVAGEFTDGLIAGIARAGEVLAVHFPRRPDDVNELPNQVEEG